MNEFRNVWTDRCGPTSECVNCGTLVPSVAEMTAHECPDCDNCKGWGRTVTREENPQAIPCPKCKRLTWPNLGVNCPAGAAFAFGSGVGELTVASLMKETE